METQQHAAEYQVARARDRQELGQALERPEERRIINTQALASRGLLQRSRRREAASVRSQEISFSERPK